MNAILVLRHPPPDVTTYSDIPRSDIILNSPTSPLSLSDHLATTKHATPTSPLSRPSLDERNFYWYADIGE